MGISGLLPLLKSIQTQVSLSELRGQTIAVDGYVWLHKGAYGCAVELGMGKPTTRYVEYAMHRVRMLRHNGIEPFLVFDGGQLPAKRSTEVDRKRRRDESLKQAKKLLSMGRHSEARDHFVKCVDITPQHAFQLIKALRAESVAYIVAPYEADAQLAYLERTGRVNGILTEDSDLLVFGCTHTYFKLDITSQTMQSIPRRLFPSVASTDLVLTDWTDTEFRHMAMLAGCDYLEGLKGVGVRTANRLLRKWKSVEKVIKFCMLDSKGIKVPKGYLEDFRRAELGFLFQRVFCPEKKGLVHLGGDPSQEDAWSEEKDHFVGGPIADELAQRIAAGDVCPVSHLDMVDICPAYTPGTKGLAVSTGDTSASKISAKPTRVEAGPMDRFLQRVSLPVQPPTASIVKESSKGSKQSGKRTLSGEMQRVVDARNANNSRFFSGMKRKRDSDSTIPAELVTVDLPARAGSEPPELRSKTDSDASTGTLLVQVDDEEILELEVEVVEQEDGYQSPEYFEDDWLEEGIPSPVKPVQSKERWSSPDIPSPQKKPVKPTRTPSLAEVIDVLSSPIKPTKTKTSKPATKPRQSVGSDTVLLGLERPKQVVEKELTDVKGILLVQCTPSPSSSPVRLAPDLREVFTELTEEPQLDSAPRSDFDCIPESSDVEREEEEAERKEKMLIVANGWRARFSLGARKETTISPIARRRENEPPKLTKGKMSSPAGKSKARRRQSTPLQPITVNVVEEVDLPVRKKRRVSEGGTDFLEAFRFKG